MHEKSDRKNVDKPQLSELFKFGHALVALVRVMEQGAKKYAKDNWLKGGRPDKDYLDSLTRHLKAFVGGEVYDPETGCMHMAQVAWNALALIRTNYLPEYCEVQHPNKLDDE